MSETCPRRDRFFGCHFEARYDLGPAQVKFEQDNRDRRGNLSGKVPHQNLCA